METGIQGIIDLREGAKSDVADLTGQVHQLPSSIKFDGPSSVSQYFKPKPAGIETEGLMVEEAYFRGRKLQGTTVSLPEGYCGFVLGKKSNGKRISSDMSEENSNCWKVNATFENIMYWNHDSLPSQNDAFLRSLHWLTVAKALHNPVTAEDLSSTSIALKRLD
ncbi:Ribonuclease H2 subunit C like [Quillaja saponaria]|uniref:Ribonuclease H2 subunit C like n=1 Tax=Quillaja saponaria TaxID=32244 RepID=A0AAD7M599_QUISA|nr:Ribonuclease H2 subunit C like [Quillaja saponaria]